MKKVIIFAIIIAIASYYIFSKKTESSHQATQSTILRVGTSADYPPYAQIDLETGEIIGLEIDVLNEIARRLDRKIELKDMPFNSLIIELLSGQIDMIAAGLSPSEERKKSVLFSHPYIDNDDIVIVTKVSHTPITKLQDLYGQSVAVNTGYTSDMFLSKHPEIHLVRLKSTSDGIMALNADSVAAFATSKSSFDRFLNKQEENHTYHFFKLPMSADACALAYRKNNTQLQQEIDFIIDTMIEDGTMQLIKNKWGFRD